MTVVLTLGAQVVLCISRVVSMAASRHDGCAMCMLAATLGQLQCF